MRERSVRMHKEQGVRADCRVQLVAGLVAGCVLAASDDLVGLKSTGMEMRERLLSLEWEVRSGSQKTTLLLGFPLP